jgi:protein arginine N-methyltransferase 1
MKGAPYEQLWIHRLMLKDLVRGEAYRKALEHVITPDSVVLDMGAGSGILSFFAVAAGARKVYAVERTSIVQLTRELAESNRLLDRLEILNSDILEINLPEKVDVLVSEWLGPFGIDENLLYPLLATRDKWLKPNGIMVPETVTAWMAPAYDPALDHETFFWQTRPYGFNYQSIAHHSANEIRYSQHHLGPGSLLAEPKPMWTTNLYQFETGRARSPFACSHTFICKQESLFNSIALWFDAEFAGGIVLACGPGAPRNHWGTTICPLEGIVQTQPGDEIRVDFTCELDETPGRSFSNWIVWLNGKVEQRHDTRDSIH